MLENDIHKNPKLVYETLLKEQTPALWLPNFKAWLVCDSEVILSYCSSNDTTSKRSKLSGLKFSSIEVEQLQNFFGDWLMYNDGYEHQTYRELLTTFLKKIDISSIKTYIQETIHSLQKHYEDKEIDFQIIAESISIFLQSNLFNISYSDTKNILYRCTNIVRIIGLADISEYDIKCAFSDLQIMRDFESEIIHALDKITPQNNLNKSTKFNILCNLLLDGHKSLVSGINNCIWLYLKEKHKLKGQTNDEIFDYLISEESPFQQLSRVALKDIQLGDILIKKGEKLLLSIGAYNYKQNDCPHRLSHLSFGYGKHYCIGARISKIIITEILSYVSEIEGLGIISYEWEETIGYRNISSLILKIK